MYGGLYSVAVSQCGLWGRLEVLQIWRILKLSKMSSKFLCEICQSLLRIIASHSHRRLGLYCLEWQEELDHVIERIGTCAINAHCCYGWYITGHCLPWQSQVLLIWKILGEFSFLFKNLFVFHFLVTWFIMLIYRQIYCNIRYIRWSIKEA